MDMVDPSYKQSTSALRRVVSPCRDRRDPDVLPTVSQGIDDEKVTAELFSSRADYTGHRSKRCNGVL